MDQLQPRHALDFNDHDTFDNQVQPLPRYLPVSVFDGDCLLAFKLQAFDLQFEAECAPVDALAEAGAQPSVYFNTAADRVPILVIFVMHS